MMAPRTIISGSIFAASKPSLEQTVDELRTELHQARNIISDLRFQLAQAKANIARLKREREKPPVVPIGDSDNGYECPHMGCHVELVEDYDYCPGCGSPIDWRTYAPVEDVNAFDRRFDR